MKRNIASFIAGFIIACTITGLSAGVIQRAYYDNTRVFLNGNEVSQEYPPVVVQTDKEGKLYGSIRSVAEALGAKVEWFPGVVKITKEPTPWEVAEKVRRSCVKIKAYKGKNFIGQGSGVIYNGQVITNKHVIEKADSVGIIFDDSDQEERVKEIRTYRINVDLATIKLPEKLSGRASVVFGDSDKLTRLPTSPGKGETVAIISSPYGTKNIIGMGIVDSYILPWANGQITGYPDDSYIVIKAANVAPGSSGGGMFNMNGELIGIVTGAGENTHYVIASNQIRHRLNLQ